jgi:RNA binding exosome subunit
VAVHNVTWIATSSAVGNLDAIEAAMSWLTGGEAKVDRERVKSYHGAKMTMLSATITRKKAARTSVPYLGFELLDKLPRSDTLPERIDEGNTLHIRLSLAKLVAGVIEFSDSNEEQVKGRIKFEVYPGQNGLENARTFLAGSAEKAERLGLPLPPE